ncbi:helix-turn-helix domain-containing protein [Acinetobacter sp. GSS19]|uniref:helix-turn-helix domain-containing protein n=1 Tax=Acinetobacter sp. GSS19 TaxID=3020716 RepID=UPI00235E9A95|nr:helix-turn-helix domain-containing protein [Acinetobacter sp. GSS19]
MAVQNMIKNNLDYALPRIQLLPFLENKSRFKPILDKILSYFRDYNSTSSKCIKRKFNKKEATHILGVSFAAFHKRLKAGILYHDQLSVSDRTNFPASILEEWLINEKKNINGTYTYHRPPPQADESNDYFTIPEIMEILNINNRNARLFLKIPDTPTTKKYLNHYTQYCLSKEFVNSFHKKYIFLSPLAEHLDVSHLTLRAKLSSLNIEPIYINKLYPAYYARKDIKHLDNSMIENIVTYKNNSGRKKAGIVDKRKKDAYISLSEAAKLLGISPSQTAQLIQHKWLNVENLEIRPYRIPRRSIDNLIQQKNDPSFVDIDVVLKALNCSSNQLQKNWIMTGYLKLRHIGYWQSFSKTEFNHVLEIHKEFFTASEANNYLGMHRTHITNLVRRGLIKPHFYGNHNYSIRLFKKEDVKKLLREGYGVQTPSEKS